MIRLGAVYVCGEAHNEVIETIFLKEEFNYDEFILEGEVEISYDESESNEYFPLWCNWLRLKINVLQIYLYY